MSARCRLKAITGKDSQDVWPQQRSEKLLAAEGRLLQPRSCRARRCHTHQGGKHSRFVHPCLTPGCLGCRLALPSAYTLHANRCGCSEDATMQQTGLSPSHLIAQSRCKSRSVRKMEHFKGEMENNTQLAPPQQPSCAS